MIRIIRLPGAISQAQETGTNNSFMIHVCGRSCAQLCAFTFGQDQENFRLLLYPRYSQLPPPSLSSSSAHITFWF